MRRLLKERRLLEGGAYFNVNNHNAARIRRHIFDVRRLLEEKLYVIVELSLKKNRVVLSLKFTLPC